MSNVVFLQFSYDIELETDVSFKQMFPTIKLLIKLYSESDVPYVIGISNDAVL